MARGSLKKLAAYAIILLTIAGFLLVLYADMWGPAKFFLGLLLMVACGMMMKRLLGMEGDWGMLLLRTKKGLVLMDRIARLAPRLWKFLADIGLVVGFGLFSLFIFKDIPRWRVVFGMVLLLLFSQFILPLAGPLALETINLPTGTAGLGTQATASAIGGSESMVLLLLSALYYLIFIATITGGLVLAGIAGLGLKALTVVLALGAFIGSILSGVPDGASLSGEAPGATFVLPGINLPLAEGILALIVLLVVHECAHGVLARVFKIRLKSTGLVLFGVIPAGAFVDPDEKQLDSADPEKQKSVLVAGSASNLATAAVFAIIFLLFQSFILSAYPTQEIGTSYVEIVGISENSPASGLITPGSKLYSWRGQDSTTIAGFISAANGTPPGETVQVVTDKGEFSLKADENGKVGVSAQQFTYSFGDWVREISKAGNPLPAFLFNFIAITFVLNILVGIINLFPIPPFDGYRIAALTCGKKKILGVQLIRLIMWSVVLLFLLNLVPWVWS